MNAHSSSESDPALARTSTLAVLAGGQGSRMGAPKSLLRMHGSPILHALHEQIAWPGRTLLVTTPGLAHPPGWQCFDEEACDAVAGQGPLRGMLTALQQSATDLLVVATVDMPNIGFRHLLWVLNQLATRSELLGVMLSRLGNEEKVEPFPCALRRSAESLISKQLLGGRRAVHSLAQDERLALVPNPPEWTSAWWTNLNCPSDLEGTGIEIRHQDRQTMP